MNEKVYRVAAAGGGMALLVVILVLVLSRRAAPAAPRAHEAVQPAAAVQEPTPAALLPLVARGWSLEPPPPPPGDWLAYVNSYRAMADLPPLTENPEWSTGAALHALYMVKNDVVGQVEDPANPWYTPEGAAAGVNSNVMGSSNVSAPDEYAIDTWMQAPFHAVAILDPELVSTGFGSYREAGGYLQMGAALDVIRGLVTTAATVTFPIFWPSEGETVGLNHHRGEYPDPLASCPGYSTPAGLPVLLQIGPGGAVPNVTAHSFRQGAVELEHCVFDETTYTNPDPDLQALGRAVLAPRDAIVLIPRAPLEAGATYTASITVNGETHTWSFAVGAAAPAGTRAMGAGPQPSTIPPRPDL